MAQHLASIYGTEADKVNCSFYFKIGACRHGDRCSRKHVHPQYSQTILCPSMYQPPAKKLSPKEERDYFEGFYEDVFCEFAKFGQIEELLICQNTNEHLMGNIYCRFRYEEDAGKAVENLNSRWYNGRPVYAELSPVTDFREACCRQHDISECSRGGLCNFIHARKTDLSEELLVSQSKYLQKKRESRQ